MCLILDATGIISFLVSGLYDPRDQNRITHSLAQLLIQCILMLAQVWGVLQSNRVMDDPALKASYSPTHQHVPPYEIDRPCRVSMGNSHPAGLNLSQTIPTSSSLRLRIITSDHSGGVPLHPYLLPHCDSRMLA